MANNPFSIRHLTPPAGVKPLVTVSTGKGPYDNIRECLSRLDLSGARGKRVLLKPNIGRIASPGSGINTHPQAVAAAIDAFREAGASAIAIGESPITGVKTPEAFEASGIAAMAREHDCLLIDLDEGTATETPIPDGKAIQKLSICSELFKHDIIVSLPVMKMHMHTGVTLSVKNMKGCLWRRSKVTLHMLPPVDGETDRSLNIAIADMAGIMRPHLAVIDGYIGMEGLGPSAGSPRELNAAVASLDAFAADAVACALMGIKAGEVPHLRIGADRGYGIIDLGAMSIKPGNWELASSPFALPPTDFSVEFPRAKILDQNSCSACQSTLLLFLKRFGDRIFDYFPEGTEITIAIGKGHADVPAGTLCIGNCTFRHKNKGIYVPGCPPVGSEIYKTLTGKVPDEDPSVE